MNDTVSEDVLASCPFCGSDNAMMLKPTCRPETPYNPADRLFPIVRCGSCCAEVSGSNEDYRGKSAITAWNRRAYLAATKPPLAGEVTDTDLLASLANDPNAVHINLLRRSLARPTVSQIIHIYGEDTIRAALSAASAVRSEPVACPECLGAGVVETCVNPDNGFLDTHAHNLRYETERCSRCAGTGSVKPSPVQTREDGIREALEEVKEIHTPELSSVVCGESESGEEFMNRQGFVEGLAARQRVVVKRLEALLSQPEPKGDKPQKETL